MFNKLFEKQLSTWHMLILLMLLFAYYRVDKYLPLRPQSVHQWAQCDRASVACNFYNSNADFFHPQVHNTDNGSGVTGVEFPIVQYTVAQLYKIFGFHEIFYRSLTLFVYLISLILLFKLLKFFIAVDVIAAIVTLTVASSPLLSFYSLSFIPDIYSFSCAIMAWYCFIKNLYKPNKWNYFLWMLLMALACLLKPNSMIHLPAMFFLQWHHDSFRIKDGFLKSIPFVIIAALSFGWYYYAAWLSNTSHSEVFLMQLRPPKNLTQIKEVWEQVCTDWLYRIYSWPILLTIVFVGIVCTFLSNQFRTNYAMVSSILLLSGSAFLFLMWLQLAFHDYYFITIFPVLIFLIINIYKYFEAKWMMKGKTIFFVFCTLICLFEANKSRHHLKYSHDINTWMYGFVHNNIYFDAHKLLVKAGINPIDQVIVVFDHSPNISLYLMNVKGVTIPYRKVDETIMDYLNTGRYKYIVYNKNSVLNDVKFSSDHYPIHLVQDEGGLMIYKVSSEFIPTFKQVFLSPWN